MSLCVVAIFKNESHILDEWITHYIKEGVNHFYLIDNGSTDNYMKHVEQFIKNGIVTIFTDDTPHSQVQLYNKYCLTEAKKYDWVMICDLDEFIYSRNGYKTTLEYLETVPEDISRIMIQWKMFGSNGYIKQPSSVINSFTKRLSLNITMNGKCIIRGSKLTWLQIHVSNCSDGDTINSSGTVITQYCNQPIDEKSLSEYSLHLNHYFLQSYMWFMDVKVTRGDAVTKHNPRDIKYFTSNDNNEYVDTELSEKIY